MIILETVHHNEQRYDTVGDWFTDEHGNLRIRVSKLSSRERELLVGIHELIEAALCQHRGITQEMVDQFDIHGDGNTLDDPGASKKAPYHKEHLFAEAVERLIATELGVDWIEYDAEVASL